MNHTATKLIQKSPSFSHIPVLLKECVSHIFPSNNTAASTRDLKGKKKAPKKTAATSTEAPKLPTTVEFHKDQELHFVDATFGLGGYTRALLSTYPKSIVHAFDMDYHSDNGQVKLAVESIWQEFGKERLMMAGVNFRHMHQQVLTHLHSLNNKAKQDLCVHGIVFDLGVSSMQLDDSNRGFSFRSHLDGPLDMRMGQFVDQSSITAKDIVNQLSEQELSHIIHDYGEEKYANRIARAIVNYRKTSVIETTSQLAQIVRSAVPSVTGTHRHASSSSTGGSGFKDPSTKTFQAIRIHVNDELASIRDALIASEKLLCPGGKLCVVSYHSLEDRIAKRFLQHNSSSERPLFKVLTKEPIVPSMDEIKANPRSRSAKLRVGERTAIIP